MIDHIFRRIADTLVPRTCAICGYRLSVEEQPICVRCNLHMPRTMHHLDLWENDLCQSLWGKIPHLEKAAAMFYHHRGSESSLPIYELKYGHHPRMGCVLGQWMAEEYAPYGFFEDIDLIIPVPLSKTRLKERGYNQSMMIAEGLRQRTHLALGEDVLVRKEFQESQTIKDKWGRNENVAHVFSLKNDNNLGNKHILLVDDIITTGATIAACANTLNQIPGIKISVLAIGFVNHLR